MSSASSGPVELLPGWRLVVQQSPFAWRGDLFDPLGKLVAVWFGKKTGEELVESACTHLAGLGRREEATALHRHWEAIR